MRKLLAVGVVGAVAAGLTFAVLLRTKPRSSMPRQSVLLFNGDSHVFRSDSPMVNNASCFTESGACTNGATLADAFDTHPSLSTLDVPNFHRIVVHGSTTRSNISGSR